MQAILLASSTHILPASSHFKSILATATRLMIQSMGEHFWTEGRFRPVFLLLFIIIHLGM